MHQLLDDQWFGPHVGVWLADRVLFDDVRDRLERGLTSGDWKPLSRFCDAHRPAHEQRAGEVTWSLPAATLRSVLTSAERSLRTITTKGFELRDEEGLVYDRPPLSLDIAAPLTAAMALLDDGVDEVSVPAVVWSNADQVGLLERTIFEPPPDTPPIVLAQPWESDGSGAAVLDWVRKLTIAESRSARWVPLDSFDDVTSDEVDEWHLRELICYALEICVGPFSPSIGPGPFAALGEPPPRPIDGEVHADESLFPSVCWEPLEDARERATRAVLRPQLASRETEWLEARERWLEGLRNAEDGYVVYRVDRHDPQDYPDGGGGGGGLGASIMDPHS